MIRILFVIFSLCFVPSISSADLLCKAKDTVGFNAEKNWSPFAASADGSTSTFVLRPPEENEKNPFEYEMVEKFSDVLPYVGVAPDFGVIFYCDTSPNKLGFMRCKGATSDYQINVNTNKFIKFSAGGYVFDRPEWLSPTITIGSCKSF
jgi:hypothetical protein